MEPLAALRNLVKVLAMNFPSDSGVLNSILFSQFQEKKKVSDMATGEGGRKKSTTQSV